MATTPLPHDGPDFGRDWIAPFVEEDAGPLPPPRPSRWKRSWPWLKRGLKLLMLLLVVLVGWLAITAPLSKSLEPIAPPRLTLLAADGQPIARNGAIMDAPVRAALLPDHVKQAFIAIEDRRFMTHWGVDPRGILRATWSNMRNSGPTQGGSTITQQLAKITFLTPERSMTRKAREMLIAFWMEGWLTKDEILERYLSNVYFGDNIYGLRAAAMHYFYRQPEKLTLPQAAMLAGLVQAPSRLAPTKNPKAARKRAQMVLDAMVATGAITQAKADAVKPATLDQRIRDKIPTGTYFADWAMPQARATTEGGYGQAEVLTTLDARLQRAARAAIARAPLGRAQVSLVAMRTNGEVVAMIGGRSYEKSPFNRATQARRQPGSTFKLFVYLAALREGMTPDDLIDDSPITQGAYRPKNSNERYRGEITLRQAFAASSNVAAVRLYRKVGDRAVIRAARDLGIKSPLTAGDPSLALGTSGVTLLELTSAYASVAAKRYPVVPHAIPQEEAGFFGKLFGPGRGMSGSTQAMMLDLLEGPIKSGTGRAAALRVDAYGKTGTSQDNRDALFIGFVDDLVVGVWVGNDDNTPLRGINGGNVPARIWRDFMGQAIEGAAPAAPAAPVEDDPLENLTLPPIDLGNSSITLGNDTNLELDTDVGGVGVNLRVGPDGLAVEARPPPDPPPEPN